MAEVLVDTDVFIDHLRGARRLQAKAGSVAYSVITRCELFAGRSGDEATITALLGPFEELLIDRPIAELAGQLRRRHEIRTPDALIAATALRHTLPLATRNPRDFQAVDRLHVLDRAGLPTSDPPDLPR